MFSERMALARCSKLERLEDDVESTPEANDLNESVDLPRVEEPSDDDDDSIEFEEFEPEEFYKVWVNCQSKYTIKILALILMDTFRTRFCLTDVAAASKAGHIVGYSERSIRSWHTDFYSNKREFEESLRGKHSRPYVLDDEICRKKALPWLHERAYDKAQPSMTAATFANWVNSDLLPNSVLPPGFPRSITPRTARKWLHDLGFTPQLNKMGLYYDGHEREDVVEYRRIYFHKIEGLEATHMPPPACVTIFLTTILVTLRTKLQIAFTMDWNNKSYKRRRDWLIKPTMTSCSNTEKLYRALNNNY